MTLIIHNANLLTPQGVLSNGTLRVENGRIASLTTDPPHSEPNGRFFDAHGQTLVPGFIDLQLNGGFGHDFTQDPATIWEVARQLPRFGTTSFLPTIITSPLATAAAAQQVLQEKLAQPNQGATPLGLHLEGPFLNPAKKGAHNAAHLQPPDLAVVGNWTRNNGVWLVTLAPELPHAAELIAALTAQGVVVSAGHSAATVAEAGAGVAAGIRYATHLFNAMAPLNHREPGLAGALLADERVTIGLIPDGVHVHPLLVDLVWRLLPNGRLNLVTDAMAAMGMPPGRYQLGDYDVTVDAHRAQLADGTLAGSIISLDEGLRRFINMTGCSLAEAVATITAVPARLLNIDDHKGQLAVGYDADMVLLTADLQVAATFVAGKLCYSTNA